jgi:hypothetical protein
MEEAIHAELSHKKIFSLRAIPLAAFIGGPMAAGWLMAMNYKRMGEHRHAQITWFVSILITIFFIGLVIFASGFAPALFFSFVTTASSFLLGSYLQGEKIENHKTKGGSILSYGWAVLIGFICFLITAAAWFFVIYTAYHKR